MTKELKNLSGYRRARRTRLIGTGTLMKNQDREKVLRTRDTQKERKKEIVFFFFLILHSTLFCTHARLAISTRGLIINPCVFRVRVS